MNFSEDVKENIRTLLRDGFVAEGRKSERWNDTYKILETGSTWKEPKKGGFGIVYQAENRAEEKLAVKEITLDFKSNYSTLQELTKSTESVKVDTAATLDFLMACQESVLQSSEKFKHVNIVKCYDSWIEQREVKESHQRPDPVKLIEFVDDETELTSDIRKNLALINGMKFFIVMELYDENLEERYSKTPPSIDKTINIVHQIASALAFIHSKGYVHRDLKPRNILITDSKVAIGDFGLCKRIERNEVRNKKDTIGTHPYNTAKDEHWTSKWDIWCLGVVVFELFCRSETSPKLSEKGVENELNALIKFANKNPQSRLSGLVRSKVNNEELVELVMKCLQPVGTRPTADLILRHSCFESLKVVTEAGKGEATDLLPTVVAGASEIHS